MRLLLSIGLALLVSGSWAQQHSFFNIDSETDLLALPSDQLIDSDIEHEAVESIIPTAHHSSSVHLPFGARLPGYERIQYAYGYQIPEKSKPKRTQSFNFPAQLTGTNSPAVTSQTATVTQPSPPKIWATTHQSTTSSTTTTTSKNPIYFPQQPNLALSLPEKDHSSQQSSESSNLEIRAGSSPEKVVLHSYLPPSLDFKIEHPSSPPLPPADSYLPPNLDFPLSVPKTDDILTMPTTFYLPPDPDPVLKVPESKTELPLPANSYFPPNTGPILKSPEPKIKLPELVDSYLPPDPVPVLKQVTKLVNQSPMPPAGLYLPPNLTPELRIPPHQTPDPLALIPILSSPIGGHKFSSIKEVTEVQAKYPVLLPFGILSEQKDTPLHFHNEIKPVPPLGVVGQHEEALLHVGAQHTPSPPVGVIKEQEDESITFSSKTKNSYPTGVITEIEDPPVKFHAETRSPPPAGVIGKHEDSHVRFTAENRDPPPAGVIGKLEDSHLRFRAETRNPPPAGVIGKLDDPSVKFVAEIKHHPPTSVIGRPEDPHVRFTAETRDPPLAGIIGQIEDQPIRFSVKTANHNPFGVIRELQPERVKPKYDLIDVKAHALISEVKDAPIRPYAEQPTHHPYSITSEIRENSIEVQSNVAPIVVGAIRDYNPDCLQNDDCSEDQICLDKMCVNACIIGVGLCVGNAVCHARQHVPACVCPDMFTAVTIKGNEQDQYDCMPMMMMSGGSPAIIAQGSTSTVRRRVAPIANLNFDNTDLPAIGVLTFPFAPLVPVAPLAVFPERGFTQSRISTGVRQSGFRQATSSSDVCRPSPCGPNTRCEVSPKGIALCRCLADFVPDGNTINGCKPQCDSDGDCPDDYRCRATKCVRVCVQGACGINADCDARNHRASCSCPNNYNGDPHIRCNREVPEIRAAPPAPPLDPCAPNPCGTNADCRVRGDRPVCTCPIGYEGDPLTNCRRGECIEANDCPGHRTCQQLRCIDPCLEGVCGSGAECTVRNHQPICSCPRGFVGDPFTRCRRFDPQELCNPTPCGRNTNCRVRNDRAVCSCIENYIGNPLTDCRPECVGDSECPHNMACRNNICVNPCRDACGEGAYCEVRSGRAVCSCPQYYQGDAYSRCFAECTAHDDCPSYQACFQLQCVDPCDGACGSGANCKVENHKPICSCPKGYTGHPFESCRPFTAADLCNPNPCGSDADCTPGFDRDGNDRPVCTCPTGFIGNPLVSCQRGECTTHSECRAHEACYAYTCQNPCYTDVGSVCGDLAECNVKNHQPVCSCPPGYDGNPLQECRISSRSRFTVGRAKK